MTVTLSKQLVAWSRRHLACCCGIGYKAVFIRMFFLLSVKQTTFGMLLQYGFKAVYIRMFFIPTLKHTTSGMLLQYSQCKADDINFGMLLQHRLQSSFHLSVLHSQCGEHLMQPVLLRHYLKRGLKENGLPKQFSQEQFDR